MDIKKTELELMEESVEEEIAEELNEEVDEMAEDNNEAQIYKEAKSMELIAEQELKEGLLVQKGKKNFKKVTL